MSAAARRSSKSWALTHRPRPRRSTSHCCGTAKRLALDPPSFSQRLHKDIRPDSLPMRHLPRTVEHKESLMPTYIDHHATMPMPPEMVAAVKAQMGNRQPDGVTPRQFFVGTNDSYCL